MRRIALALLLFFVSPLLAQAPPGFVTVTGSRILDGTSPNGAPIPLTGGRITAQFMAKGQTFNASIGGGGQLTTSVMGTRITNGAFTLFLPDTFLTNPQYACLQLTIVDPTGNPVARYPCVQPGSAPTGPQTTWCSTVSGQTTCNFDLYRESIPALAMTTPGPAGPAGPAGTGAPGLDPTAAATGGLPNGIANLIAGPRLAAARLISIPPTYPPAELNPFDTLLIQNSSNPAAAFSEGTAIDDTRGGTLWHGVTNPQILGGAYGTYAGRRVSLSENRTSARLLATGGALGLVVGDEINTLFTGVGNDDGASTHGKSTFLIQALNATYNTVGQLGGGGFHLLCLSNSGDCNSNENYINTAAGSGMGGGEGTHGMWEKINGVTAVPTGTCSAGCTPGSTLIKFSGSGYKQLGQNRFLLDVSKAQTLTLVTGTLPSGSMPFPGATFQGSTLGTSIFLESSIAVADPSASTSPGLLTVPIKTAPDFPGFSASTSALPSSGIACISDSVLSASDSARWESAPYTVVDATHLSIRFFHLHKPNFAIAVGGACGKGFEQTATTANGIRQIFPALGSTSDTTVLLATQSNIFGISGASAFAHIACAPATIERTANVATLTFPSYYCGGTQVASLQGLAVTVAGMTDASFNAASATASLAPSGYQLTYPSPGPNAAPTSASGATVTYWTSGAKAYPMAETQSVLNSASDIDGTLLLGANTIPFAPGDALEQPVGSYPTFNGAAETLAAVIPVLTGATGHIVQLTGTEAFHPGTVGYGTSNSQPITAYQGAGGTNPPPHAQFFGSGPHLLTGDFSLGKAGGFNLTNSPWCTPASTYFCNRLPTLNFSNSRLWYTHDPTGLKHEVHGVGNADFQLDPGFDFLVGTHKLCLDDGTNCPATSGTPGPAGPAGPTGATGATGPQGPAASTIANIQIALPTASIPANSCTTPSTAAMPGVKPTSTFTPTFASDSSSVTGWGATGGLDPILWPTPDTLNFRICNVTAASITPGAITLNVGAR